MDERNCLCENPRYWDPQYGQFQNDLPEPQKLGTFPWATIQGPVSKIIVHKEENCHCECDGDKQMVTETFEFSKSGYLIKDGYLNYNYDEGGSFLSATPYLRIDRSWQGSIVNWLSDTVKLIYRVSFHTKSVDSFSINKNVQDTTQTFQFFYHEKKCDSMRIFYGNKIDSFPSVYRFVRKINWKIPPSPFFELVGENDELKKGKPSKNAKRYLLEVNIDPEIIYYAEDTKWNARYFDKYKNLVMELGKYEYADDDYKPLRKDGYVKQRYVYEFDRHGNYTKKTNLENGSVETREIYYYE
ncbi:MAG TPA: hypothetical protein VK177_18195 [Flavobacteriales bacterium]|nr:hypothetical protein [Flavobacteriales bacterium]